MAFLNATITAESGPIALACAFVSFVVKAKWHLERPLTAALCIALIPRASVLDAAGRNCGIAIRRAGFSVILRRAS